MHPHELFALPVGTRVEWVPMQQLGTIIQNGPAGAVIRFDCGYELELERDFEHLADYAGGMEVIEADKPHVAFGPD